MIGNGGLERTTRRQPAGADSNGRRRVTRLAGCLLTTAVLSAACTRSTSSADGDEVRAVPPGEDRPSLDHVCGLLKPAEVEAALDQEVGKPYEPPPQRIAVGMRHCEFGAPEEGQVTLGLSSAFPRQVFDKAVAKLKVEKIALVPVRNLGDEAAMFFGGLLLIRQNPYVLYVGVARAGNRFSPTEAAPSAVRRENIALALKALDRLSSQQPPR